MPKLSQDAYDAVIIGAGIGGLVCGCYLAKAGMKVLIAEQHFKPGGYCTSFKRQGFTFDAAAHSFGGYRKDGIVRKIFEDLAIDKKIRIKRFDPIDIIKTPDYEVIFWADLDKTIDDLQNSFPDERDNIREFLFFLRHPDPNSLIRIRSCTFKNLLDGYFKNDKLKAILSFPLFGNGGLPPSQMSAFIGTKIFTETLLDGGYYSESGMQALPDAFVEKFKEFGGEIRLSCLAKKIKVGDNGVKGVVVEKDGFISSKSVVSSCDARQTFLTLIGRKKIGYDMISKINNMKPSLSMFVLYLGMDEHFSKLFKHGINLWYLPDYDLDKVYNSAKKGGFNSLGQYLIHISHDRKSVLAYMNTSYINDKYWKINKRHISESFLKQIEKEAIPGISDHIVYQDSATPQTLNRYTLNYKGAAYGWAPIPEQLADPDFKKPSFIRGLYLAGHWSTLGLGIPGVAYMGYNIADLIMKKYKLYKG